MSDEQKTAFLIQRFDHLKHDRSAFKCAIADSLPTYLVPGGGFDQDVITSKVVGAWVLTDSDCLVQGYYTLGIFTLDKKHVPQDEGETLPYKQVGFVILSRIATDDGLRGRGYGQALLYDAVKKSKELAEPLGAKGVYLEARNEKVAELYQNFGFESFPANPLKMVFMFKNFQET